MPKPRGVAAEDRLAHGLGRGGNFDGVPLGCQALQRLEQRFEHGEELRRACRTTAGREVEQHDADAALGVGGVAQRHQLGQPRRHRFGALGAALHRADGSTGRPGASALAAGAGGIGAVGTPAEYHRRGAAVELRNGDHDRRFERQQALPVSAPALQRLELDRVRGEVGHIEPGEDVFRRCRIVVGGAADEAEAGQV